MVTESSWRDRLALNSTHVFILLIVIAVMSGVLIALSTSNSGSLIELRRHADQNSARIDKIERDLEAYRRSAENYQNEQRQNVTDFRRTLDDIKTDIKVEQAKKRAR